MDFRAELSAWLDDNAPRSLWDTGTTPFQGYWGGAGEPFETDDQRLWFERCLARGWTAPTWPRQYGGGGMPTEDYRIFSEELARRGLPRPLVGFGLAMIGPILLSEASDALKEFHLPRIARGEIRWCQGYSEPGAGSDLASLQARAERDGDHYVVSGQKIWTSHADTADWIFCLVRTDPDAPERSGITFLLIDMSSPGVTTRPIQLISGSSPFCEVFLEDVRVPVDQVVGRENDGWRVAKALLQHERGMVGESVAAGGARAAELTGYTLRAHALETIGLRDGRLTDPLLRDELARFEMTESAFRQTIRRANERVRVGAPPGPESSIFKVAGADLNQHRWELAVRMAGLDGLGWEGAPYSERDRALTRQWLRSRGNSIEGGTNEIQRNIIARRVLGMPR